MPACGREFYERLQSIYGVPGSVSTLESAYNEFTSALHVLTTSPDSASARSAVVNAAQVLTQQLNGMTDDIQALRGDAELGLADAVTKANEAMLRIAEINRELATANAGDATTANLLDRRDVYIDQLSQLMDIKVIPGNFNQLSVFTNSGVQLVGINASTLEFEPQGSMNPLAQWSNDPAIRNVGTIVLKGPNGSDVDLLSSNAIRSGQIAAYLEMRDEVLVQAQTQLDEIAGAMARALSDRTINGSPVNPVPQAGFDIDLSNLIDGNSVRLTYTDNASGQQRTLTLMRVDDPDALPLSDSATIDPNDRVVGLDFSGGIASVLAQVTAALGSSGVQVSNPAGNTLRFLDDGLANKVDLDAVSATYTVTSLTSPTGGVSELPFFVDGDGLYTGAIRSMGSQTVGFAGRIAVNANLVADPSRLVVFQTTPADGVRRCDAAELPLRPPQQRRAVVFAAIGRRRCVGAVQRHDPFVHAPGGQPARRSRRGRRQSQAGPGRRVQRAAAAVRRHQRGQHRPGDGQSAQPAECLRRQRARADDGQGNARPAFEDMRSPGVLDHE